MAKKRTQSDEAKPIVLTLPYPPSVNKYWRRVGNRTVLSRPARNFRVCVKDAWLVQKWVYGLRTLGPVAVQVKMIVEPPDKRKRDLDNVLKAVLDAIEAAGIIDDDAQVRRLIVEFTEPTGNGAIHVTITPIHTPSRQIRPIC